MKSYFINIVNIIFNHISVHFLVSEETGLAKPGIAQERPRKAAAAFESHLDKGPYFMTADDGIFCERNAFAARRAGYLLPFL